MDGWIVRLETLQIETQKVKLKHILKRLSFEGMRSANEGMNFY